MAETSIITKSTELFRQSRSIVWGDTDSAGIVYTGRVPQLALEAIEDWFRDRLGTDWYRMTKDDGIGTPFVHIDLDFRHRSTPRDTLSIEVALERIGRSSLHFRVTAKAEEDGILRWEGRLVCVFIDMKSHGAVAVPASYRQALADEVMLAAEA